MRFDPPPVAQPAELSWLLGAAFGPEPTAVAGDPARLAELAARFDLGPRIVARHGARRVEELLGPAASQLVDAHRRAVAIGLAGENTVRALARLAASRRLDLVFLKGYAMERQTALPPGGRPYADLDVLLSRPQAAELRELLTADGWTAAVEPGNPQHLPPVLDPEGLPVDIHFRLRGVRVAEERWATAEELLDAGLCRPSGVAAGTWLPVPTLLAAHLAVHALEQHGHRPTTYPMLRAVGDLIDLLALPAEAPTSETVGRLVGEELESGDLRALFSLARLLAAGRTPAPDASGEDEAASLFRHIVAGVMDPAYRQSLTIDHTAGRLRQARRDGELMRYIARKLTAPTDPSDAASTGSARGQSTVHRRALRPIRLVARFTAAAAARMRRLFDR